MLGYSPVDHVAFECNFVGAPGVRLGKAVQVHRSSTNMKKNITLNKN
jgi:hypothetical protein